MSYPFFPRKVGWIKPKLPKLPDSLPMIVVAIIVTFIVGISITIIIDTRIVKLEKKLELITPYIFNFDGNIDDEIRQNLIKEFNKIDNPKGKPANIKRWLRPE